MAGLFQRLWDRFLNFVTSEPGGVRTPDPTRLDASTALLRDVDALRKVSAQARAHAGALAQQVTAAEEQARTLEAAARSQVEQRDESGARATLRLKVDNDRRIADLRRQLVEAQTALANSEEQFRQGDAEARARIEQRRELVEIEARQRELAERKPALTDETLTDSLQLEQARLEHEAQRLRTAVAIPLLPEVVAARRVEQALDEAAIEAMIARMKKEYRPGSIPPTEGEESGPRAGPA